MKPLNHVSRETQGALEQYHALLLKWQERINLISPTTIPDAWSRHFVDSIQVLPLIPKGAKTLYDLGSGAGFPGMILAMARSDLSVTLVESDAKKCAFLQTVSRETGTKVSVANERIEKAAERLAAPDVITARALASLESLFSYCYPWIVSNPDLALIFPKGEQAAQEMEAARAADWIFDVTETVSETDRNARILTLTKVSRKAHNGRI